MQKVQVRFGLGDIDKSTFDTTLQALQTELYKVNEQLTEYSQKLSNVDEIADHACVIACKLSDLWNDGDCQSKVDLQNLLFPDGVLWDRNIGNYRTEKTNSIFETINRISNDYAV